MKANTGGLILVFPALPTTTPKSLVLQHTGMKCYFREVIVQTCYAYPEVNMILIDKLTDQLS